MFRRNHKKSRLSTRAKKPEEKRAGGRPTSYKAEYAEQAAKLCLLGATDFEVAQFFGVSTVTIWRWRNEHAELCNAVIAGKDAADDRVERSLYNRAVGYTFESEKVFQFQGEIVRAKTLEHVPPDPGAAMNWLKNRRKDTWRDKTEIDHRLMIQEMPDDELDRELARALAGEPLPESTQH